MENQQIIINTKPLQERLIEKRSEANALRKKMSYEETLYAQKQENLSSLRNRLLQYIIDGDIKWVETMEKYIREWESEIKDIVEGRIVLKSKPRDMTEKDIAEALTKPEIANNKILSMEISFGMIQKKDEITGKKLLSIINSPFITKYIKIIEELNLLKNEELALNRKELETKKADFTKTYYQPIIDKISQLTEKAYQELEEYSKSKDQMKTDYGMTEKAAMESLSYEEKRNITNTEYKIRQLDEIQDEMRQIYDNHIMSSKSESGFEEGVRRLKSYVEKKKTEEWRYPVVKLLFVN